MAFYGDFTMIEDFTYRGMLAQIFRAVRGGHCDKCDLDHEPYDLRCSSCGDEILPRRVFRIFIAERDIDVDAESALEAKEFAKAWIDDALDRPPEEEPERPKGELILPPPPKGKRGKKRRRRVVGDPLRQHQMVSLVEQVKQLGWGKRALAIMRAKR